MSMLSSILPNRNTPLPYNCRNLLRRPTQRIRLGIVTVRNYEIKANFPVPTLWKDLQPVPLVLQKVKVPSAVPSLSLADEVPHAFVSVLSTELSHHFPYGVE